MKRIEILSPRLAKQIAAACQDSPLNGQGAQ
jgi:hypothetical protein